RVLVAYALFQDCDADAASTAAGGGSMTVAQQADDYGNRPHDLESSSSPPPQDPDQDSRGGASGNSLWSDFARGVRDSVAAEVVVQAVRVGGLIFLARALRPQDFGLLKVLPLVSM